MTFKLDSRAGDSSPSTQYVIYAEDIDFIKTETKDIALSSFRTYNNNVPQHLSKGETFWNFWIFMSHRISSGTF